MRVAGGRTAEPSAAVLDSRTVKTSSPGGPVATTGAKKINGRKHHILVGTMGLLLKALVAPANVTDRDGGAELIEKARAELPSVRHLFVDRGYQGRWVEVGSGNRRLERGGHPAPKRRCARGIWWPKDEPLPD